MYVFWIIHRHQSRDAPFSHNDADIYTIAHTIAFKGVMMYVIDYQHPIVDGERLQMQGAGLVFQTIDDDLVSVANQAVYSM